MLTPGKPSAIHFRMGRSDAHSGSRVLRSGKAARKAAQASSVSICVINKREEIRLSNGEHTHRVQKNLEGSNASMTFGARSRR